MATKVSITELGSAVSKILTAYNRDIQRGIREETRKSMRALVAETKATAPVGHRHKHYRDSIAISRTKYTKGLRCERNFRHKKYATATFV